MRQTRAVAIDEFIEYEFAIDHVFTLIVDILCHAIEKLNLHSAERFSRFATSSRQLRMSIPPLVQFAGPLLLLRGHHTNQIFEQLVRPLLRVEHVAEQIGLLFA